MQHLSRSCRNAKSSCAGRRHTSASVCPSDEPGRRQAAAPGNRRAGQRCCRYCRRRLPSWRAHSCAEEHAEPDAATVGAVERGSHDSRGALHRGCVARSVAAHSPTRRRRLESLARGAGPFVSQQSRGTATVLTTCAGGTRASLAGRQQVRRLIRLGAFKGLRTIGAKFESTRCCHATGDAGSGKAGRVAVVVIRAPLTATSRRTRRSTVAGRRRHAT